MTGKWVTPSTRIDSLRDWGTERVIVSFTLTQNNRQMMDDGLQWRGRGGGAYSSWGTGMKAWWTSVENGNICVRTKESKEQQSAPLSKPFSLSAKTPTNHERIKD